MLFTTKKTIELNTRLKGWKKFKYKRLEELKTEFRKRGIKIGRNVQIGNNVSISYGVHIGNNVRIGINAYVGHRSIVGHHSTIGKNAEIGQENVIGPDVFIGSNTEIGLGNKINTGTKIGRNCSIGGLCIFEPNSTTKNWQTITSKSRIYSTVLAVTDLCNKKKSWKKLDWTWCDNCEHSPVYVATNAPTNRANHRELVKCPNCGSHGVTIANGNASSIEWKPKS